MRKIYFENHKDFVTSIINTYNNLIAVDSYDNIAIIAKYDDTREIIKELLKADWNLRSIDLHDEDYDSYDAEYITSLSSIDENYEVWCEPMLRENGYLHDESIYIYILDTCSSKVIPYCNGEEMFKVTLESSCDDDCKCGYCYNCCERDDELDDKEQLVESDDDMHGFSVNKSDDCGNFYYSFYSTDKDLVSEMTKMFRR